MTVDVILCAPTVNTGELKALGFLRQKLDELADEHIILSNYHLPDGNHTLEIDLVVLNRHGVFLLEVKDWFGRVEGDSIYWLQVVARRRHLSPLTSIDAKAKRVHGVISDRRSELRDVSVVGFVVLTQDNAEIDLADHPDRRRRVFKLTDDLIHALTSDDFLFSRYSQPLNQGRIRAVKNGLVRQKVDPRQQLVGNYEIIGELTPGDTYDAFEARHVNISSRHVRLKKYHIPVIRSLEHLEETIREFKQDMEALSQVDSHPHIVRAYDFFKDPDVDDTYYLALELVDGKMLRELIDAQELTLAESAQLLIPVTDALAFCHRQGIVHRNLTPYSIYITDSGLVKLGDFDFARVPAIGQTITKTGQVLVETKYTAPEQLDNPREVDYRADLYSLGVVWYDMLFRRPEDEPVRLALIQRSDLSIEARNLLRNLLASRPPERPASIEELKQVLESLINKV